MLDLRLRNQYLEYLSECFILNDAEDILILGVSHSERTSGARLVFKRLDVRWNCRRKNLLECLS